MIIGTGIDIINTKRLESWCSNTSLLNRYFHPEEITFVASRGKSAPQSLAARFGAKEAFGKALGTGLTNLVLKDIMVINDNNGRPQMQVIGTAKTALEKSGANKVHISISHEKEYAVVMIVLEKV